MDADGKKNYAFSISLRKPFILLFRNHYIPKKCTIKTKYCNQYKVKHIRIHIKRNG